MLHRQRWRPDTCECAFQQEWDDTMPSADPTLVAADQLCAFHSSLTPQVAYTAVIAENTSRSKVFARLLDEPELGVDTVEPDGRINRDFDPAKRPVIVYGASNANGARSIIVRTPGLSRLKRLAIITALRSRTDITVELDSVD